MIRDGTHIIKKRNPH